MHQQIRAVPAKSPPDLVEFLQVIADEDISILAASGTNLELGGEFAFSVDDGEEGQHDDPDSDHNRVLRALQAHGYTTRVLLPILDWIDPNQSGTLLDCIRNHSAAIAQTGSVIREIAVGVPRAADGFVPVQIFTQEVKTVQRSS